VSDDPFEPQSQAAATTGGILIPSTKAAMKKERMELQREASKLKGQIQSFKARCQTTVTGKDLVNAKLWIDEMFELEKRARLLEWMEQIPSVALKGLYS
jgi:hypothetical protein